MKHLYLYGASDDCREIETDFDDGWEAYGDIEITADIPTGEPGLSVVHTLVARYGYDGDWGIRLEGLLPPGWTARAIVANAMAGFRSRPSEGLSGQFIHLQIPDDAVLRYRGLEEDGD